MPTFAYSPAGVMLSLGKVLYFLAYKMLFKNPETVFKVLYAGYNIMECSGARKQSLLQWLSAVLFFVCVRFKIFVMDDKLSLPHLPGTPSQLLYSNQSLLMPNDAEVG